MAGDLEILERAVLAGAAAAPTVAAGEPQGRAIHRYGQMSILAVPGDAGAAELAPGWAPSEPGGEDLDEIGQLGLAALRLRESGEYRSAKESRPRAGEAWDMPGCTTVAPTPRTGAQAVGAFAAGPTSSYLEGSVAVGIVIVQGPTPALQFSDAERTKVVAEVQNGLGWLAMSNPPANISFTYDIRNVVLTTPANPSAPDLEAHWRDPAMAALGFGGNWGGVLAYVEDNRRRFRTDWTFCAFFTKYPLNWFAYASIGGPRLVMDYNNDGWGPDNIDRVFAHEVGHVFGAPDEYAASGCNCGGGWGRFGVVNGNCESCAGGGGVSCLMKGNTFDWCDYTPSHLGWAPKLVVNNLGYDAGGWRVDRHPRMLADTTGDGRADVIGFGNAGVWVSRARTNGTFTAPQLVVNNFGYDAGGWRVGQHPRFLADLTGDGRADIVGFGNAGVWVSLNNGDGTFRNPQLAVKNFGYDAGGWRVDRHPRLLADVTGDGRPDIIGFGNAGAYIARSNGDGTFAPLQLAVSNFGYDAGGWRVDRHPRLLADTTGDGRADIVGFGNAGAWVSRL